MIADLFARTLSGEIMMHGLTLFKKREDKHHGGESLGQRLKSLRTALSLTQKDAALRLGIAVRTYQNYEQDEREPGAAFIVGMKERFGVAPLWLLTGEGPVQLDERDDAKVEAAPETFPAQERRHDITLGEKLKRYRQFRGFSRLELARRIGTNPESVARYERGNREPSIAIIEKLAASLEIDSGELLKTARSERSAMK